MLEKLKFLNGNVKMIKDLFYPFRFELRSTLNLLIFLENNIIQISI